MPYTKVIYDWFFLWLDGASRKAGKRIETLSDLEKFCSRPHLNSVAKTPINGLYLVFAVKEVGDEFLQLHFSFVNDNLAYIFGSNNQDEPTQFWTPNFYIEIGTNVDDPLVDDVLMSDLLYPNGPPIVSDAGFELRDLIFTNREFCKESSRTQEQGNILALLEDAKNTFL